ARAGAPAAMPAAASAKRAAGARHQRAGVGPREKVIKVAGTLAWPQALPSLSTLSLFLDPGQQSQRLDRRHVVNIQRRNALAQMIVRRRRLKQPELPLRVGRGPADGGPPAARQL